MWRAIPCRCRSCWGSWSRRWAWPYRRRSRNGSTSWGRRLRACAIGLFLSDKSIRSGLAEAGLATLIKPVLQPLLVALLLPLFVDLRSVPGQVALVMASLPTAANAFVLAKQFDIAVERNSAAVLLSTAFSVITLSALLVWLRVS
jgi:predicted permease